jgi:hypothetical protein
MCASPLSPRHAQPDWMGGGLVSRQMMHAPPSAAFRLWPFREFPEFEQLSSRERLSGQAICPFLMVFYES